MATDIFGYGDGSIVVAGSVTLGAFDGFAIARYTSAGVLDTSFGYGTGYVTASVASIGFVATAGHPAIDVNGNIDVAGTSAGDFIVFRFTSEGVLDTTFGGGNGYVMTAIGSSAGATGLRVFGPTNSEIEVAGVATHVKHAVDGTRSTQDFASRPENCSSHCRCCWHCGQENLNSLMTPFVLGFVG